MGLVDAVAAEVATLIIASTSLVADLGSLIADAQEARCRVLLVTEDSDALSRYRLIGAAGVVHRGVPAMAFPDTVAKVRTGGGFVLQASGGGSVDLAPRLVERLTPSELEILALLMEGLKTRRIAEMLEVAEYVVRDRFQMIFDKTGFSNRLELAMFLSCLGMREVAFFQS
jgi:DNA-binding NarL/FixJ family response regulator